MDELAQLLQQWSRGDTSVVGRIATSVLPTVRQFARSRLGEALRQKLDSEDVTQDAILEFLGYGPRFVPRTPGQLCELLLRIVVNTVRDRDRWFTQARRAMSREHPIEGVEPLTGSSVGPVRQAEANEAATRLRLALELLHADYRRVLLLEMREGRSPAAIGAELGISADAVRAMHRRAHLKLLECMTLLQRGDFDGALRCDGLGSEPEE